MVRLPFRLPNPEGSGASRPANPFDPGTIVVIRWLGLAGQLVSVCLVYLLLGFDLPLLEVVSVIAIGGLMNLWQMRLPQQDSEASDLLMLALGFDVLQPGCAALSDRWFAELLRCCFWPRWWSRRRFWICAQR